VNKALGIAAAALVIALGTGAIVLRAFLSKGLAPETGTVRIEGLIAPVKVIRDRAGIPHIFAGNPNDLLCGHSWLRAIRRRAIAAPNRQPR
jgi:penicillin G amidase